MPDLKERVRREGAIIVICIIGGALLALEDWGLPLTPPDFSNVLRFMVLLYAIVQLIRLIKLLYKKIPTIIVPIMSGILFVFVRPIGASGGVGFIAAWALMSVPFQFDCFLRDNGKREELDSLQFAIGSYFIGPLIGLLWGLLFVFLIKGARWLIS